MRNPHCSSSVLSAPVLRALQCQPGKCQRVPIFPVVVEIAFQGTCEGTAHIPAYTRGSLYRQNEPSFPEAVDIALVAGTAFLSYRRRRGPRTECFVTLL